MTPFTAATMSSKSAASLIWNGWLLIFPNDARLCRCVYQETAALFVCMQRKFMSLCALSTFLSETAAPPSSPLSPLAGALLSVNCTLFRGVISLAGCSPLLGEGNYF